jgi:GntR family transcriptional regulator, transcriptional repressor for pyruvate dehydrogenase complex
VGAPLTDAAIQKLREMIITGRYPSGAKLPPEAELAAELGLSRNTAREAVRALSTARVLDVRRGDGTYVTSLRPELLLEGIAFAVDLMHEESGLELLQVRRILEPAATAMAAANIGTDALDNLERILVLMQSNSADLEAFVRYDADFHAQVAAASDNQTLASMLNGVSSGSFHTRVWQGVIDKAAISRTILEHHRILDALRARDIELARAAALTHVCTTEEFMRQMLAARVRRPAPEADRRRRVPN